MIPERWKMVSPSPLQSYLGSTPHQETYNVYIRTFCAPHHDWVKLHTLVPTFSFLLKSTLFKSSESTLLWAHLTDHFSTHFGNWLTAVCCPGSLRPVAPAQSLPSRESGKTIHSRAHSITNVSIILLPAVVWQGNFPVRIRSQCHKSQKDTKEF